MGCNSLSPLWVLKFEYHDFLNQRLDHLSTPKQKIAGWLFTLCTLKELFSIHHAGHYKCLWRFYEVVNEFSKIVSQYEVHTGFEFVILLHQLLGLQYYAWIVHFNVAFSFWNSEKWFQRKFHIFFLFSFYLFLFVWLLW